VSSNPLRVLDCKIESCKDAISDAPVIEGLLCTMCRDHFEGVKESLELLKTSYTVNQRMVRGLDYYTRTTFEIICNELGAQNAVVAGGRYDKLVRDLGGPDIPAFGFALGMERLVSLIEEKTLLLDNQPHCYLIPLGENAKKEAIKCVKQLREGGMRIEMSFGNKGLKWHLKKIDKMKARYVLILGDNELEKSEVTLRDMEKGVQKNIPINSIFSELKACLAIEPGNVEAICS
jgi:histidyl-tRNA synthetase